MKVKNIHALKLGWKRAVLVGRMVLPKRTRKKGGKHIEKKTRRRRKRYECKQGRKKYGETEEGKKLVIKAVDRKKVIIGMEGKEKGKQFQ